MSFFKSIWKNNSKHKKLCEELALANSIRDYSENHDELDDGSDDAISFSVKYLGNTVIQSARSEEATSEAVKSIITNAKAGGKKLQRVSLSISPKGIEMFDQATTETLLQVSIYNISYCSSDASHDHVFAFVGCSNPSSSSSLSDIKEESFTKAIDAAEAEGSLVCYAFLCQKRKMAQTVTLTVARSFERAYQIWQNKQFFADKRKNETQIVNKHNLKKSNENEKASENSMRSLLIDFNSDLTSEICSKDHREYLQNTWVSFEDDQPQEFSPSSVPKLKENLWGSNAMCFT